MKLLFSNLIKITSIILLPTLFFLFMNNSFPLSSNIFNVKGLEESEQTHVNHREKCGEYFKIAECAKILPQEKHRKPDKIAPGIIETLRKTLLVVHYNTPEYGSAVRSFTLYSKIFAKIVFCGPEEDETKFWPHYTNDSSFSLSKDSAPFIAYGPNEGRSEFNPYLCVPLALNKFPGDYPGVVAMSDDVIFNYWNIDKFNKSFDKIWIMMNSEDMEYKSFEIDHASFIFIFI